MDTTEHENLVRRPPASPAFGAFGGYFLVPAAGATQHVTVPSPHLPQLSCMESVVLPFTTVISPLHSEHVCLEPTVNHSCWPWFGGPTRLESRIMTVLQPLHCIVTVSFGPAFLASANVVTGLAGTKSGAPDAA